MSDTPKPARREKLPAAEVTAWVMVAAGGVLALMMGMFRDDDGIFAGLSMIFGGVALVGLLVGLLLAGVRQIVDGRPR